MATLSNPTIFKDGVITTGSTKRIGTSGGSGASDYIMRFTLTPDVNETTNFINFSITLTSDSDEVWSGSSNIKYYFQYRIGTDPNELAGQSFISEGIHLTENRLRISTSNSDLKATLTFETNTNLEAGQTYYIWIYRLYISPYPSNYTGIISWYDNGTLTYTAPTLTTVEASLSNAICFQNYETTLKTLDSGAIWKYSGAVLGRFFTNETNSRRAIGTMRYDLVVNKSSGASGLAISIPSPYNGSYLYADDSDGADVLEAGHLKLKFIITPYNPDTLPEDIISEAGHGSVTLTRTTDGSNNFTMDLSTDTSVILMPNTRYHLWLCPDFEQMEYTYTAYLGIGINYFREVVLNGTSSCVCIDTGTGWESYIVYIDTGTEWVECIPYIDNGTSWDVCT